MANLSVRWGMTDFIKWRGILVMGDDFEMGVDTPLLTMALQI